MNTLSVVQEIMYQLLPLLFLLLIVVGVCYAAASVIDSFQRIAEASERIAKALEDGVDSDDDDDDDDLEEEIPDPPPGGEKVNLRNIEDIPFTRPGKGRIPFLSNFQN